MGKVTAFSGRDSKEETTPLDVAGGAEAREEGPPAHSGGHAAFQGLS